MNKKLYSATLCVLFLAALFFLNQNNFFIKKNETLAVLQGKNNFEKRFENIFSKKIQEKKFEKTNLKKNSKIISREKNFKKIILNEKKYTTQEQSIVKLQPLTEKEIPKQIGIEEAIKLEFERTKNPLTGVVPIDGRTKALEQTLKIQKQFFGDNNKIENTSNFRTTDLSKARWLERGPGNFGGRTRAILIDLNDASRNTLFVGGSTGGIFKNTNIKDVNSKWSRINDWMSNLSIGALAQDPRNPKIMYAGTGDGDGGDVAGSGIFKSMDRGNTWQQLSSTNNTLFSTISSIAVSPDSSYVFAATFSGIYKSKDFGNSWQKVLGSGGSYGDTSPKFYRIQAFAGGIIYTCSTNSTYKSTQGGDQGTWKDLNNAGNGYPSGWLRTELAVAPSDPKIIYITGNHNGIDSLIYRSDDGGDSWSQKSSPAWVDGCGSKPVTKDFTRGQAFYDLTLAISPTDPNLVYVGGVDQFISRNGGGNWTQTTYWPGCTNKQYAHADQHAAIFEPNNPNVMYTGTDGGIFRADNASGTPVYSDRNNLYVTTQAYACAIHPGEGINYYLAGFQDNGTIQINAPGLASGNEVIGGDGFLCFIDQLDPKYQLGSLYYGAWFLSKDGGKSFGNGANSNGKFLTPSDYDARTKILYAQTKNGDLWRWDIIKNITGIIDVAGFNFNSGSGNNITHVFNDESVANRVYVSTSNGQVVRIDSANKVLTAPLNLVHNFGAYVSNVDVERADSSHILATVSSYGNPHVWESKDGGATWINITGNLPDMPVRYGIFSPTSGKQAVIATETGVWLSQSLDSSRTIWFPPAPTRGTPLVRTDMLRWRKSDKTILAATFGRGLWTTSAFSPTKANSVVNHVTYVTANTPFYGDASAGADNYLWRFGDGATDTLENTFHAYNQVGTYIVSLNINNDSALIKKDTIKVLPQLPTPYKKGVPNYAGDFESDDSHFGAYSVSGSKFQKGKSVIAGKAGTHSGNNAYVLGLNEQMYQKNTEAYLYLPMFDLSKKGIYQFSFWAVYDIQKGYDGMQVQYSLDKGLTWQVLGSSNDPQWYDYTNKGVVGSFTNNESYFSGTIDDWTRFQINISQLSGNANVAFRFMFRSTDFLPSTGIAIDDVEISKYEGALRTAFVSISGVFTNTQTSIDISFSTQPEYFAQSFDIEISENAQTFRKVGTLKPQGYTSADLHNYTFRVDGTPLDVYYFRIKSYSADPSTNYTDTIVSPIFAVNRTKNATLVINKVFPTVFSNNVTVVFNDNVTESVLLRLYDDLGRTISETTLPNTYNNLIYNMNVSGLAQGIYFLQATIGSNKPQVIKLFSGN